MKFIKTVSFLSIMTVAISSVSYGAPMTAQIRRLLEEKEEKIKQLEQCDGKRKGWMIAGISTIGLTAVGIGVNIAQSNKSNRLSDQIDNAKQELDKHQYNLSNINSEISEKEREKAEVEKAAREEVERRRAVEEGYGNQGGEDDITDDNDVVSVETQENRESELDKIPPKVKEDGNQQRVVDADCLAGDLPTGATKGHYITFGTNKWTCVDKSGKNRGCSCAAQACDESAGYELARNAAGNSQGWCRKKPGLTTTTTVKKNGDNNHKTSNSSVDDANASVITSNSSAASTQTSVSATGSTPSNNAKSSENKSSASSSTSSGVNTGGTKSKISDSNGKSFTEADWDKKVSEFNNKAQQRYLLKTQVTHDPTVNAPGVYTKSYDRATQKDYDDIVNEINKMDKEITVVSKYL